MDGKSRSRCANIGISRFQLVFRFHNIRTLQQYL
jgi:hypothetical protein